MGIDRRRPRPCRLLAILVHDPGRPAYHWPGASANESFGTSREGAILKKGPDGRCSFRLSPPRLRPGSCSQRAKADTREAPSNDALVVAGGVTFWFGYG